MKGIVGITIPLIFLIIISLKILDKKCKNKLEIKLNISLSSLVKCLIICNYKKHSL